jgi:hypothetical protein
LSASTNVANSSSETVKGFEKKTQALIDLFVANLATRCPNGFEHEVNKSLPLLIEKKQRVPQRINDTPQA